MKTPRVAGLPILLLTVCLSCVLAACRWREEISGAKSAAAGEAARVSAPGHLLVYVGTYTGGKSEGIYLCRLELADGSMTAPELVAETVNPSFLAVHPGRKFLYAVNEIGDFAGEKSGAVSAFAIDPASGRLTFLDQKSSGGGGPCHLTVDRGGTSVLMANYGGGSSSVRRLHDDGRLGAMTAFVQHEGSSVNPRRQAAPHAHSIDLDAANRFALVCDLGLDKVLVYRFDAAAGTLMPNEPAAASVKPGAGPRHLAFHPIGRHVYVINEIDCTVTAFAYDAGKGALRELQTVSTRPAGFEGNNSTAEIQVAPSGGFLYGSNRGHDSIVVFKIDPAAGTLTLVEHEPTGGKTPRNFAIDPTGRYLLAANQGSDSIVVFRVDARTGEIERSGHVANVPTPVCVTFLSQAVIATR